jgi:hypothetical protein
MGVWMDGPPLSSLTSSCRSRGDTQWPDGPLSFKRLRLHARALCLKGDRWVAVAGIDHVYHKCRMGLIDNPKPLKRLHDHYI